MTFAPVYIRCYQLDFLSNLTYKLHDSPDMSQRNEAANHGFRQVLLDGAGI